jgi:hypothetical protein
MDHSAVAYEQTFYGDESEVMLQWFNSQYINQIIPMQPDLLPLHDNSSSNSFPNLEFYNADPCNRYESNPINCSFLPSVGHETYQQGMECMPEDPHATSYCDVNINHQHACRVFTDEMAGNKNVLQLKGKRKLEISCYEKETSDDSECISNNVPRKKSRSSVRVIFFLKFITLLTIE